MSQPLQNEYYTLQSPYQQQPYIPPYQQQLNVAQTPPARPQQVQTAPQPKPQYQAPVSNNAYVPPPPPPPPSAPIQKPQLPQPVSQPVGPRNLNRGLKGSALRKLDHPTVPTCPACSQVIRYLRVKI